MSLLLQIKSDQLVARKNRSEVKASLLTTLLAEASAVGKNKGNRDSTDEEVIAVIKKFINNTDIFLAQQGLDEDKKSSLLLEKATLSQYLPLQMDEDALFNILANHLRNDGPEQSMGALMKFLKTNHAGTYDGKLASKVAADVLAAYAGGVD